jgi:WD40 repeat protein
VRYSADGRFLAASFDLRRQGEDFATATQIVVWDVAAPEKPIRRIDLPIPSRETGTTTVALSPDGGLLYVGAADPPSLTIYRVATGEQLRSVSVAATGRLEINPDGTLLAVPTGSAANEIVLLDAATLAERGRLRGHTAYVSGLRFSHDGALLASASFDRTAIVWDVATGDRLEELRGHAGGVLGLGFSPEDTTLYTASIDEALLAWDLTGHRRLAPRRAIAEAFDSEIPQPADYFAHSSPTGDAVAYLNIALTDDGEQTRTVQWLDVTTGRAGEIVDTGHPDIGGHAWRADGRRFATAGQDGFVRVWDWHTHALVTERQVTKAPLVGARLHRRRHPAGRGRTRRQRTRWQALHDRRRNARARGPSRAVRSPDRLGVCQPRQPHRHRPHRRPRFRGFRAGRPHRWSGAPRRLTRDRAPPGRAPPG